MPGKIPFSRYLDTAGNGTGTKNAVGDYSGAVEEFYLQAAGGTFTVNRLIISIEDTSGMAASNYGNLATLTNGVTVKVEDNNGVVISDLTDGLPVKTNAGWSHLSFDVDLKTWGAGNEVLVVRWTFANHGYPVKLEPGWQLIVSLNDNFTGLLGHYFCAQGYR